MLLLSRFQTDDYSIKGPSHAYVASSGTPKRNKRKTGKFAFISASDSESDRGYRSRVKRRTQVRIQYLISLSHFAV